jgi:hypothetical protein
MTRPMPVLSQTARIVLLVLVVAAIVVVLLVTGFLDDRAKPGSGGRVLVPTEIQGSPTPAPSPD